MGANTGFGKVHREKIGTAGMKVLFVVCLLLLTVPAFGQPPSITIKASLEKIRAQLIVEATEKKYEIKENLDDKLVIQGKSVKRGGFKYGFVYARIGPIPDQRITYRFKQQGESVVIEAVPELVAGTQTAAYKKGEKDLKKQLAALKKKMEK
jgi:hypothetical protein